jgi:DHA2 family multidrug resistance protein
MSGAVANRESGESGLTVRRQWLIAMSVTFGTMMGALDAAIINVALSDLRRSYGATIEDVTWLSTAYIIATVLVMPLTGFLGRRFGQKRVYLACLTIFSIASALCAIAPTLTWLIVLRAVQGFGAGALQPTEQAILRQTFPADKIGVAMGVFSLAVGIGPLTGPTLGGWIVDHFHWSWIFLINVPVGVLGLAMVGKFVPADEQAAAGSARSAGGRLDWLGIALLWMTLLALQYVLEEGQRHGWFESGVIVGLAAIAGLGISAFVRHELRTPAPAVNLRVFRDPTYTLAATTGAIAMAVTLSGTFLLPVFMQELLGTSAMSAGMAQLPRTLVMVVAMPIVGKLYNRLPPRASVLLGLLLAAAGQLLLARMDLQSDASDAVVALMLQGLGMSVVIIVLSTLSLARISKAELGDAAGLAALLRQVGVSTGLAMMATVLAGATPGSAGSAVLLEHAPASAAVLQARVEAFRFTFTMGALIYLSLLPMVWFLRPPKR